MSDITTALTQLSEREAAQLPTSLFPIDDITRVTILGTERKLRALPFKLSKRINEVIAPLRDKIDNEDIPETIEADAAFIVGQVVKVIADAYGWSDVVAAVSYDNVDDFDISLYELHAIITRQLEINGGNDYLLNSLRWLVTSLQYQVISQIFTEREQLRKMTIQTTNES